MKIKDEIFEIIAREKARQKAVLSMIPSENYASAAVREAVGSILMNKYAEGQAGKRYYQGNEYIDEVERLAKTRALKAFHLDSSKWAVNVQAHSGCPANLSVYNALLKPGDKIMSMYLPDGGHLSHGWQMPGNKVTLVSKIWKIEFYHVERETRLFDYDKIAKLARKFRPQILISGGTAYPREINHKRMGQIARSVGALYLADVSHEAGLISAGANSSPFLHADIVTMTTHKTLRGPRGALIFSRVKYADEIDRSVFPGLQGGPHEHTIGGIAVALKEADTPEFRKYAKQIVDNARLLAKLFKDAGIDVVSGGTDKHLVLLDLRSIKVSAWVAAWALEYAGIILNRNTVPYDTGSPYYPSGIRMGTPAITSRGMKEAEMKKIAKWIIEVFNAVKPYQIPGDKIKRQKFLKTIHPVLKKNPMVKKVAREVKILTSKFPIP